jgi:hypothetical protein
MYSNIVRLQEALGIQYDNWANTRSCFTSLKLKLGE